MISTFFFILKSSVLIHVDCTVIILSEFRYNVYRMWPYAYRHGKENITVKRNDRTKILYCDLFYKKQTFYP